MNYLLGLDVSTTATKAVLVDTRGCIAASAVTEYTFQSPQPQWAEQDPALYWNGAVESIRLVLNKGNIKAKDIAAVGLTGQMHGLTLLDEKGEVVRPCILWNDQRTSEQCAEIERTIGANRLLELTGNPALTGFTAPKILWVRQHEAEAYRRIAKILLPKDYVRYRLTGECFSDVSDASGTLLLNVRERRWCDELLQAMNIPSQWLPEVTESTDISANISLEAARVTGLVAGTPVVGGASDQAAQAIGSGIVREGLVSANLGTSGVVFAACNEYRPEPAGRLHTFCHAVPGMWHWMGVMLSAGGSLRWFRDVLGQLEVAIANQAGRDAYELLTEAAAQVPPGCEGLFFLPYLTGERTPHCDPNARGAFIGLTVRHSKAHLIRATLEGVAYGLLDSFELMRSLGLVVEQVYISGGGARSTLWRQILADVFNAEIIMLNVTEGAAYGAALLAGVGVGVYVSVQAACQALLYPTNRTQPGAAAEMYAASYPLYRNLYPALKPIFESVTTMVNKRRYDA